MDRYTKTLLTIIAVSLVCIVLKDINIIPNANAALSGVTEVKVVDFKISQNYPIPVKIQGKIKCE